MLKLDKKISTGLFLMMVLYSTNVFVLPIFATLMQIIIYKLLLIDLVL